MKTKTNKQINKRVIKHKLVNKLSKLHLFYPKINLKMKELHLWIMLLKPKYMQVAEGKAFLKKMGSKVEFNLFFRQKKREKLQRKC